MTRSLLYTKNLLTHERRRVAEIESAITALKAQIKLLNAEKTRLHERSRWRETAKDASFTARKRTYNREYQRERRAVHG